MKKISFLFLAAATVFASCQKNSYKVQGEIEGAQDGDSVIISRFENGRFIPSDTLRIEGNKFTMKGTTDSTVICSYFYGDREQFQHGFFFLEPGDIQIKVGENDRISGTPTNEACQKYSDEMNPLTKQLNELYASDDSTAGPQIETISKQITDIARKTITDNADNAAGFFVFLVHYSDMEIDECLQLIEKMAPAYQNQPIIVSIKKELETQKATEKGQKFIDFTVKDIDGNDLVMSDIVKSNKLTLLDCWASWCGPCMAEVPNVVNVYKEYKGKGLEIVGISFDQDEANWKEAIQRMGMTWRQASELNGWDNAVRNLYGVNAIPFTLLINQDGIIVGKNLRGEELAKVVAEELAK